MISKVSGFVTSHASARIPAAARASAGTSNKRLQVAAVRAAAAPFLLLAIPMAITRKRVCHPAQSALGRLRNTPAPVCAAILAERHALELIEIKASIVG